MATSRSPDRRKCTATALVYSGRPDPVWPVPASVVKKLETIWKSLEPCAKPPAEPSRLGYRGCRLKCGRREWFAYGGVVSSESESRCDPLRQFEAMLLASAPPGLLPKLT